MGNVSIHAARAGGDDAPCSASYERNVSIHAARAGGDPAADNNRVSFQSTPPARAATLADIHGDHSGFNPRRRARAATVPITVVDRLSSVGKSFQSTPPARAATGSRAWVRRAFRCFNPRRPRGRRHFATSLRGEARVFQSTPPARAATHREGAGMLSPQFQSTPPARAATMASISPKYSVSFQSTPPARAATGASVRGDAGGLGFNPRRPRGRRPHGHAHRSTSRSFNPRRPRGRRRAPAISRLSMPCFNPRRPRGAATHNSKLDAIKCRAQRVSIHAARAGGDRIQGDDQTDRCAI
jgi:hypothetical protein